MSFSIDQVLRSLALERGIGEALRAPHVGDDTGRGVVFGGELLGQAIVAATRTVPDKRVKSVQSIFARPAHTASPVDIATEVISDPDAVGPATLQMWVRFHGTPTGDVNLARAVLSYATDGWLIGTALRPHAGIGQSMAHREISTGVVSHALVFHDAFDPNEWLLIDHKSVFAGGGRCYGSANVFTEGGRHVASFTQEALLRRFPAGQDPQGRESTIM